jgi:hypothetical protein
MNGLVRSGFRPPNLPPKSQTEKQRHQAHVEHILTASVSSPRMSPGHAREAENRALDALWRTELMTQKELVITDQMKRLWSEYGLPSRFVRSVMWCVDTTSSGHPRTIANGLKTNNSEEIKKLIELDIIRTLPFLGQNTQDKSCFEVLSFFSSHRLEYTQGMSYICVRLMIEFNYDKAKTLTCLDRILIHSPTVACMYRLDMERIALSVEFILESIGWDNIPSVWLKFKNLNFHSIDFFVLEWVLTMFVKNFGLKISGFVLDLFFLQGDVVLFSKIITGFSKIIVLLSL